MPSAPPFPQCLTPLPIPMFQPQKHLALPRTHQALELCAGYLYTWKSRELHDLHLYLLRSLLQWHPIKWIFYNHKYIGIKAPYSSLSLPIQWSWVIFCHNTHTHTHTYNLFIYSFIIILPPLEYQTHYSIVFCLFYSLLILQYPEYCLALSWCSIHI
jgi:hypothetical protein